MRDSAGPPAEDGRWPGADFAPNIPRLSAGMFTISYSCAMAIAVLSGAAWDLAGDARFAFLPVGASVLGMIFSRRQSRSLHSGTRSGAA